MSVSYTQALNHLVRVGTCPDAISFVVLSFSIHLESICESVKKIIALHFEQKELKNWARPPPPFHLLKQKNNNESACEVMTAVFLSLKF